MKQPDDDLTPLELSLKQALKQVQDDPESQHTLDDLQKSYQALEFWDEALNVEMYICNKFYSNLDSPNDGYANSIHTQGKLMLRQLKFQESMELYQKALKMYAELSNDVQRGHVLMSISGWHFFRDHPADALRLLVESEPLLEPHPILLIKNLDNQGLVYQNTEEYGKALEKYRQALQLVPTHSQGGGTKADEMHESFDQLRRTLQMNIADMLGALERPAEALALYQTILETVKDVKGEDEVSGVVLHQIGTLYAEAGDYDAAMDAFVDSMKYQQKAMEAQGVKSSKTGRIDVKRIGRANSTPLIKTLISMGALLGTEPDFYHDAKEHFHRALMIARSHTTEDDPNEDPDVKAVLLNLALLEKQHQSAENERSRGDQNDS